MAESGRALLCWPSFPSFRAAPMIEIRAARHPDDAAAVEAIFREYVASPTVGLAFQDYTLRNPAPSTEFPGRDL